MLAHLTGETIFRTPREDDLDMNSLTFTPILSPAPQGTRRPKPGPADVDIPTTSPSLKQDHLLVHAAALANQFSAFHIRFRFDCMSSTQERQRFPSSGRLKRISYSSYRSRHQMPAAVRVLFVLCITRTNSAGGFAFVGACGHTKGCLWIKPGPPSSLGAPFSIGVKLLQ